MAGCETHGRIPTSGEGVLSLEHLIAARFFDAEPFWRWEPAREASYCFGPGEKHCMDEDAAPGRNTPTRG